MSSNNSTSSSSSDEILTGRFDQFASAVILNLVLLAVVIVVFWILRSMKRFDYFFAPHYYDSASKGNELEMLPALPRTPWGWAKTIIKFPESRILYLRGLDSVMYLRVIKVIFALFVLYIPLGIGLLIPIDHTGGGGEQGIPKISMTNIRDGSGRLYAHTSVAFVFTFIAFWFLYKAYESYASSRQSWMMDDKAHNYSVMFKGVHENDLKAAQPTQFFSGRFANVAGAHYSAKDDLLYKWVEERKQVLKKLRLANSALAATGQRPMHKLKLLGPKVDSINQYDKELAIYNREIGTHYDRFIQKPAYNGVAFATFNNVADAYSVFDSTDPAIKQLHPVPAPDPEDVYWEKLDRSQTVRVITKVLTYVLIFALVFLWSIPVVFLQGIANLENLSKTSGFGWLSGVVNWNPVAKGIIQQYLPALFTILFFALLPKIIEAIVKFRGVYTKSELSRQVFKIYFLFLIFNVFLVTLWSGGIFTVLGNFSGQSGWDIVQSIGSGVAAQAMFFINYVLVYMLFKYPLNIIRIGDLVMSIIKTKGVVSEEERRDVQRPQDFKFGTTLAVLVLLFAIGFTYSVLSAFIIPFMVVFFGVAYLINKYMIIYVYYPSYDSGGLHWPICFNRIIASMLLGQIVLIGVFILRKSPSAAIVGPLPLFTLAFALWLHRKYDKISLVLPQEHRASAPHNGVQFSDAYQDPINQADNNIENRDIENVKGTKFEEHYAGQANALEPNAPRM